MKDTLHTWAPCVCACNCSFGPSAELKRVKIVNSVVVVGGSFFCNKLYAPYNAVPILLCVLCTSHKNEISRRPNCTMAALFLPVPYLKLLDMPKCQKVMILFIAGSMVNKAVNYTHSGSNLMFSNHHFTHGNMQQGRLFFIDFLHCFSPFKLCFLRSMQFF